MIDVPRVHPRKAGGVFELGLPRLVTAPPSSVYVARFSL